MACLLPAALPVAARRPREAERGFTGTALTGLTPVAAAAAAEDAPADVGEGGPIDMDAELAAAAAAEEAQDGATAD